MTPLKTQKEVRRCLGFVGYYIKFIPRYSDIARPLTNLTQKDIDFEWSKSCQIAFEFLEEMLLKEPILKYQDPNYGYILYMDASKYAWAGVLTQEFQYMEGDKKKLSIIPSLMLVDYFTDHRSIGLLSLKKPMQYICP